MNNFTIIAACAIVVILLLSQRNRGEINFKLRHYLLTPVLARRLIFELACVLTKYAADLT